MKESFRRLAEGLARRTTRRGLFSRGANVAFGALAGAAAGTLTRPGPAGASHLTDCVFPGPACPCMGCQSNGVCAKPCLINTTWYASGCWVTTRSGFSVTCCDCTCPSMPNDVDPDFGHGPPLGSPINVCGCGTDFHTELEICPDGTA